jgi:hypothetical protein
LEQQWTQLEEAVRRASAQQEAHMEKQEAHMEEAAAQAPSEQKAERPMRLLSKTRSKIKYKRQRQKKRENKEIARVQAEVHLGNRGT